MDDFNTTYNAYVKAQAEANERNKTIVFDALANANITTITINFDGCGDSGQIEEVSAFNGSEKSTIPQTPVKFEDVLWGSNIRHEHDDLSLSDAVENLCYGYLSQMYGGWENNDGAFGQFTFNVARRTIEFEFNGRYTEYSTDSHSL